MPFPANDKNLFGSDAASCQSAGKAVIWTRPRWEKPAALMKGGTGAEGATAPETLRQKDQQGAVGTLERSVFTLAEGITISGEGTEGAQENGAIAPDCEPAPGGSHGAQGLEGAFWTDRLNSRKPRFTR